ncbi:uncharacterized protein LOC124775634 [Schistocerca piceifrons]|uniref:uncharacterized protein LOC124775634 n=1 Tax=Schistocerca piceifrons TaxID=274613 RepID=UPI001F5FDD90|nr:uncharacterized protein LOC124775634 [Schistocerca piceifrons]
MKIALICLAVAVTAVLADKPIEVVSRQEVRDEHGQYSLSYQTANGISVVEHGELKPTPDGKDHVLIRSGQYQYTSPEGKPVDIKYKADEFGFVATGDAIPLCLVVAVSYVLADTKPIEVISREEVHDAAGQYSLTYQTANGITVVEHGELKPTPDGKDHVLIKSGQYQYTSPEGKPVDIKYKADEFGFVATGDAIPLCLVVAVSYVLADTKPIEVISREEVHDAAGQYSLTYQTANGITVVEHGELKPTPDGKDHVLIKSGQYQYTSPEGKPVDIKYKADEFGYVATGDAIPVAPVA